MIVVGFFVATIVRKLSHGSTRQGLTRDNYVWASICAYVLSVICGFESVGLSFTGEFRRAAIVVSVGLLFALASLGTAIYARGAGRILAILSGAFLVALWIPMFLGRVLNR